MQCPKLSTNFQDFMTLKHRLVQSLIAFASMDLNFVHKELEKRKKQYQTQQIKVDLAVLMKSL